MPTLTKKAKRLGFDLTSGGDPTINKPSRGIDPPTEPDPQDPPAGNNPPAP